jgi:hypothetical protein
MVLSQPPCWPSSPHTHTRTTHTKACERTSTRPLLPAQDMQHSRAGESRHTACTDWQASLLGGYSALAAGVMGQQQPNFAPVAAVVAANRGCATREHSTAAATDADAHTTPTAVVQRARLISQRRAAKPEASSGVSVSSSPRPRMRGRSLPHTAHATQPPAPTALLSSAASVTRVQRAPSNRQPAAVLPRTCHTSPAHTTQHQHNTDSRVLSAVGLCCCRGSMPRSRARAAWCVRGRGWGGGAPITCAAAFEGT